MFAVVDNAPLFPSVGHTAAANHALSSLISSPSLNATTILCGVITGLIGWVAFSYGRKQGRVSPMIIGVALMAYPYFITNTILMVVIGVVLTVSLYVFRE